MTKHGEIKLIAEECGLSFAAESGTGTRRYKFWQGTEPRAYHEGGHVALCHGVNDALQWCLGYKTARELTRLSESEGMIALMQHRMHHRQAALSSHGTEEARFASNELEVFVPGLVKDIETGKHRSPILEVRA